MLLKSTFHLEKPNNQSLLRCCSTRLVISFTQSPSSTLGASPLQRCRASFAHSGWSGIPVQNLNKKANATPKYRGLNCGCIAEPADMTKRCICFQDSSRWCTSLSLCSKSFLLTVGSKSLLYEWPALLQEHKKLRTSLACSIVVHNCKMLCVTMMV